MCESCRLRFGIARVVVDGEQFIVCSSCAEERQLVGHLYHQREEALEAMKGSMCSCGHRFIDHPEIYGERSCADWSCRCQEFLLATPLHPDPEDGMDLWYVVTAIAAILTVVALLVAENLGQFD